MKIKQFLICCGVALPLIVGVMPAKSQTVVAVLDSGVTVTPDLSNNMAPEGFDFINNDMDPADDSQNNHGTAVARVIVAIDDNNKILAVKTINADFQPNRAAIDAGYQHAAANPDVRIINHSNANTNPATPQVIIDAAAENKIIVMSAGNDGAPNPGGDNQIIPSLGGRGISVGGLNSSNTDIAGFSNRAGNLADFYVLAPTANQFTSSVGTSMAAPHVSGVAAQILNQAPFLDAEEVVEIILTTARDMGAPGVDSIYGHGALDAQAALAPVGDLEAPSSGGSSGAAAAAALVVAGAIGYAVFRRNKGLKKTLVLDKYGRGYTTDMESRSTVRTESPDLQEMLNAFADEMIVETVHTTPQQTISTLLSRSGERRPESTSISSLSVIDNDPEYTPGLSFISDNGKSQYQFDLNTNLKGGLGAFKLLAENDTSANFQSKNTFTAPYFGFSDSAIASKFGYRMDDNLELKYGFSMADDQEEFGLNSESVLFEGSYRKDDYALNLQVGYLDESGSLLGGASRGAFSVDETQTLSLGLSASYRLSNRFSLIGSYTEGYSKVDHSAASLLQNFSSLRSRTYGLGLVGDNLLRRDDQFGIAISKPVQVSHGSADLDIPYALDINENVYSNRTRTGLTADGSETNLEAYYRFGLSKNTELTTYFMYRDEPDHDASANGETGVFAALEHRF